jgi:hypothetical protein
MRRKSLFWIAALALAAVLGLSAQASASTVKGTVVYSNKSAHSFVVAGRSGHLTLVSSRKFVRAGSKVRVSGRKLKTGAIKAKHLRVRGHARRARLRGLITWSSAKGFTVAARGASLLVHRSRSDDPAPLGAPVQTGVTIDDQGDLNEDNCHQVGDMPGQVKLEGTVLSTDPVAETITISGDDDEAEHMGGAQMSDDQGDDDVNPMIVVHVPDATQFTVGDRVELIVTGPAADGSFTLVSVDEDNQGEDHSGPGRGDDGQQVDNSGPGSQSSGPGDGSGDDNPGGGDDGGHGGSDG